MIHGLLDILNLLTTAEIVLIIQEDPEWRLPAGCSDCRRRMESAWIELGAGARAIADEHRAAFGKISTEAA